MSPGRRRRAAWRAVLLVVGVALLAAVLYWQRAALDGVATALLRVGIGGLAALCLFHFVPLVLDAAAWRLVLAPPDRVTLRAASIARLVGEGFSALLPAAQVGGEIARGRALALLGVPPVKAGASVVVDVTVGVMTQVVYCVAGIAAFVYLVPSAGDGVSGQLVAGIAVFAALAAFAIVVQLARPFRFLLRRIGTRMAAAQGALAGVAALEDEVVASYRRRGSLVAAVALRLAGWLVGAGEFWLALNLIGVPVGLAEAIMLESLVQAVRTAAFMVPSGFGVQEAALVAAGGAVGLGPEAAIALSLVKRAREWLLGAPGLGAWYWLEHRAALRWRLGAGHDAPR